MLTLFPEEDALIDRVVPRCWCRRCMVAGSNPPQNISVGESNSQGLTAIQQSVYPCNEVQIISVLLCGEKGHGVVQEILADG